MSIIKDLKNENDDYTIINSTAENCLNDLSKINIFVGANNTGKSRFMRSLYKNHPLHFLPNDEHFSFFSRKIEEFGKDMCSPLYDSDIPIRHVRNDISNILRRINEGDFVVEESVSPFYGFIYFYNNHCKTEYYNKLVKKYFDNINIDDISFKYDFYKIYIPSLRGLIPLITSELKSNEQNNDVYGERINKDYFSNEKNIIFNADDMEKNIIISGLQFYEYITNYLLGNQKQREIIKKYETYLSNEFFEGKEVALIPKVKDDVLTIKIGNEERPIYDLGEGIQSIILITLPLFLYLDSSKEDNTNVLVFIEEPEIGLHPRLQRKLIETLLNERFDNFQFFFTTHSNHFLDRQFENEDVSIYLFDKNSNSDDESFSIEKVDFNHFPILKKLGALPSAVYMSNCIILVEGSYDIKHFKHYLNLYQEYLKSANPNNLKFNENVHYSFLRGGGSELYKTVEEFKNIYNRLFCIVDNDNNVEKKINKFNEYGFNNYYILEVREVENLIPENVLIESLKNIPLFNNKNFESYNFDNYKHSNFFDFITKQIFKGEFDSYPKTKMDNLKNKTKKQIALKQQELIDKYEDLTDEAKTVVEKMYKFISNSNK